MDQAMNVVTLDWRRFGDFSAVGQLTRKIFAYGNASTLHAIQCWDDGVSCSVFRRENDGELVDVFDGPIRHDAVLHYLRRLKPTSIYVRLSTHTSVLELACKLSVAFGHVPQKIHYMDQPFLDGMAQSKRAYLWELYSFLIRHSDGFYAIHRSSADWVRQSFGREARILSNFITQERFKKHDLESLSQRKVQISYFGSIDRRMNASAIADFCRVISNLPWVSLSIWSNSGIWGEVKRICDRSDNIFPSESNLDDDEFRSKMSEADLLLLPYNFDKESTSRLKHSFSNKFVDYAEVGGIIFCLGSSEIPTVQTCIDSGLALVVEDTEELEQVFRTKARFLRRLQKLDISQYAHYRQRIKDEQEEHIRAFFDDLKNDAARSSTVHPITAMQSESAISRGADGLQKLRLSFLIRRKFFDHMNRKQSLSATLMAHLLKANGYQGFDYEI